MTVQAPAPEAFVGIDVSKAGLKINETYYSSNDELLAKLNAGGTKYDIIAPSQNAVAQLIETNKLMKMDDALIPNKKNLDPKFLKASYDPTGEYHVIKDYGITMFFYNNTIITEKPQTMLDFYNLLNKYVSKGRTNILDGAEEVVGLAPEASRAQVYETISLFRSTLHAWQKLKAKRVRTLFSILVDQVARLT